MGLIAGYANDVFISYSHIDNQPFSERERGWVDNFHENLQNFVNVHLGQRTQVWRDKRLTGAEVFSDEIEQQLRNSAVLVSIISPGYLQSEWCRRELLGFTDAAHARGSLHVGNLQRVLKVLRLPIERAALPGLLDEVLGAQFFRVDAASERARDLLLDPAPDALQVFRARVDDVAHDLARLLRAMQAQAPGAPPDPAPPAEGDCVYLAWTTSDLDVEREKVRRELEARRYRVLPAGAPPLTAAALRAAVRDGLQSAKAVVHLVGANYGFVPEGEERSVVELQIEETTAFAPRLFWLTPTSTSPDVRLSRLIDRIREHAPQSGGVDVLANQPIEELKVLLLDRLNPVAKTTSGFAQPASAGVYLVCDQLDRPNIAPLQDYLFDQSFEVRLPLFDGDAEQVRAEHYETLKECDGVLIFWGKGREGWLRTMMRDLNKVFGLGRSDPYKATSLYLAELPDPAKQSFRTRELPIIAQQGSNFDPDLLRPFVAQLSSTRP